MPEPVGPVTRNSPFGRLMMRRKRWWSSVAKPSAGSDMRPRSRSRMRITIDSPWYAGSAETRRSISRPWSLMLMRPSCGLRFSEMSIPAISLMRERIAGARWSGGLSCSEQ